MGRAKKKALALDSSAAPDFYLNLELDIHALRGKNKELVQTVAKLQQEKSALQKEITTLQQEYFAVNSKYADLKKKISSIRSSTRVNLNKVTELVQHFTSVIHLCTLETVTKDLITQAVTPHRVNGAVIQNPIITLNRFGNNETANISALNTAPSDSRVPRTSPVTRQSQNVHSEATGPDSNRSVNSESNDESSGEDNLNETAQFISTRNGRRVDVSLARSDIESDNQDTYDSDTMDIGEDQKEEEEENIENDEYCTRLVTIEEDDEEEYDANQRSPQRVIREIRICLSPLCKSRSKNKSTRSISMEKEVGSSMQRVSCALNKTANSEHPMEYSNSNIENVTPIKRKSDDFVPDNFELWNVEGDDSQSFTFTLSSTNQPNENSQISQILNDSEKISAMRRLGLEPAIAKYMTTSTPVVSSPRTSRRLNKRKNISSEFNETLDGHIAKRKRLSNDLARVVLKRLGAEGGNISESNISEAFNVTPVITVNNINSEQKCNIKSPKKSSNLENKKAAEKNVQEKQKRTKKKSPMTKPKSPRPVRAARPLVLKDANLIKKMRRSR